MLFADIRGSTRLIYNEDPERARELFRPAMDAMIEGVRQPAVDAGLIDRRVMDEGIRALKRTTKTDGVFCYTFFKAVARR